MNRIPLCFQEPKFSPEPAAITAEAAVSMDHAMARDQDGDAVEAVGVADCAGCARDAQFAGEIRIPSRFSKRDDGPFLQHILNYGCLF